MAQYNRVLCLLSATMIVGGLLLAQQTLVREALEDALRAAEPLAAEGQYSAAVAVLKPAVRAAEGSVAGDRMAVAWTTLAALYQAQWRYSESEPAYRRAVRLWETQRNPSAGWHIAAVLGLARVYQHTGRFSLSKRLLQQMHPAAVFQNALIEFYFRLPDDPGDVHRGAETGTDEIGGESLHML